METHAAGWTRFFVSSGRHFRHMYLHFPKLVKLLDGNKSRGNAWGTNLSRKHCHRDCDASLNSFHGRIVGRNGSHISLSEIRVARYELITGRSYSAAINRGGKARGTNLSRKHCPRDCDASRNSFHGRIVGRNSSHISLSGIRVARYELITGGVGPRTELPVKARNLSLDWEEHKTREREKRNSFKVEKAFFSLYRWI
ncbi:hypothetical protein CEXT_436161 [Caerostris extrusa]|uniref:Ribosomal protein L2 n=1 Tax=Caerostris extrusa TaxID=172846 RepID=A0AAV4MQ09_CAEEX|nr:hypothetical protein CEXT_436161 [Caerostris extrusa]